MSTRSRIAAVAALALTALLVTLALPPVPQDPSYHEFADARAFLGVPNLLNVASNLPFIAVGIAGLIFLASARGREPFRGPGERRCYAVLFLSLLLIGIGSSCYHWRPTNETLFWDRLPMTLMFASFLGITVSERISARWGAALFTPLLAAGVASIFYWRLGDSAGRGDLRFYGLLQGFTMVAVPLIVLLFPPRYSRGKDLLLIAGVYALAKACEILDGPIHAMGGLVSGHTFKHLLGGCAAWRVLVMLRARRPLAEPAAVPSLRPGGNLMTAL